MMKNTGDFIQETSKKFVALSLIFSMGAVASACGASEKTGFEGGCAEYAVYSQNRWDPLGAAIYSRPERSSKTLGGFAGNEVIAVNGWIHTNAPAYRNNQPPWNSDIWFHLANEPGWVDFAAVRAERTTPDPTGLANGGVPAPTPLNCEGTYTS